jgi:hypothetical protein
MKITIFSIDSQCSDLLVFNCAHVTMFEEHRIKFQFGLQFREDQMNFIKTCIENYVLIEIQGDTVIMVPEERNSQRVRVRFD